MEFLPPVDPAALTRDEKKFIGRTIQEQMQDHAAGVEEALSVVNQIVKNIQRFLLGV